MTLDHTTQPARNWPRFDIDTCIAPELRRAAAMQPNVDYVNPVKVRSVLARAIRLARLAGSPAHDEDLTIIDRTVPARPGSPDIPVRVYRARGAERGPALVFFHGGAFAVGDLDTEDHRCRMIAARGAHTVVSVNYRLAPEHPFPAGFEDCYDSLRWVARNADELNIDPGRVAVGGTSAGGALAAAVAQAARDDAGPPIAFQLLLYPVIDDRLRTASMVAFETTPGWNRPNSVHMWQHYLGRDADRDSVSQYAAPGRAGTLVGLPPAYVVTAEFDPLRDEGIDYARALMDAGVPTELHNHPATFHCFDAAAPFAQVSTRALAEQCQVLQTIAENGATGLVVPPEQGLRKKVAYVQSGQDDGPHGGYRSDRRSDRATAPGGNR